MIDVVRGASYASTVAQWLPEEYERSENDDDYYTQQPRHVLIVCGSPIATVLPGNTFFHILLTTHQCKFIEDQPQQQLSLNTIGAKIITLDHTNFQHRRRIFICVSDT